MRVDQNPMLSTMQILKYQTVNAMKTMSYNNVSYKNYLNFGQNYAN